MKKEIKRTLLEEDYITEEDYPTTIKPNFSVLGSIIEIEPCGEWRISFVQDDTLNTF